MRGYSLRVEDKAMKSIGRMILVLGIAIAIGGCENAQPQEEGQTKTFDKVRGPAVAGMFYPKSREKLTEKVDKLLAEVKPEPVRNLRGLICPHAGYEFSGKTAAIGYKQLAGRDVRTVIVMAPSHCADFKGASVPDVDAYETPLGMIPVSPKAAELGKLEPFVVNPTCKVIRPAWWRQAPKDLPPFGEDTPHSWEHSLEVQLPFLQRVLKDFQLVPVVFSRQVDPEAAAEGLIKLLDERTILVASSDLSHYEPYEWGKGLDTTCCKAICSLMPGWVERQDACGSLPILTLVHVARKKGWKAILLDYRNSGDTTGDKSRGVVGYAAIAFYEPDGGAAEQPVEEKPPERTGQNEFAPPQRKYVLALARKSVTEIVTRRRLLTPLAADKVPKELTDPRAVFVTLTIGGRLRGCIGDIWPRRPLYQAVIHSAASAAVRDRRFRPVGPNELDKIEIEVSVLTLPKQLEFKSPQELLGKLRPKVDGVVLRVGNKSATYLPQVWEQIPGKEDFLNQLAEKAKLEKSAWRGADAVIQVYQVEAFEEVARD